MYGKQDGIMKGQSLVIMERGRYMEGENSGIKKEQKFVAEKRVVVGRCC